MITNFYPIESSTTEFTLQCLPYSEEKLDELRQAHNRTYSFFRVGEFIYAVHMEGVALTLGESVLVRPAEAPEVTAGVVRHLLFRTFVRKLPGLKPLDFYPLRFLSRKVEHDAAREHLPKDLQGVLTYTRLNEIQTRKISPDDKSQIGVLINIERHWNLTRTVEELTAEGFDATGCAIVHAVPLPGLNDVLAPTETSVGRALAIKNGRVEVDTSQGRQSFPASEMFLRKSAAEIRTYLAHRLGGAKASEIFEQIFRTGALAANAHDYHREIGEIADYLAQWDFTCPAGFSFRISCKPRAADVSLSLQPTTFRFDISPGAASTRPFSGLAKFGPYDSRRFSPKKPRILVVCRPGSRAGFTTTMAQLENGIPESQYFQKGLRDFFRLSGIEWQILEADTSNADALAAAVESKLTSAGGDVFSLAVVEGDEADRTAEVTTSPYYRAKALLMGAGIPVQALQPYRTRMSKAELGNILGPLALQMYAKLGGTPWVLQASVDVDHEIVVGIGHYLERSSEFAGAQSRRVVGLTTFFSSDGSYLMARTCRAVDYDGYFNELLTSLEACLQELAHDYAWKDGSTVRIVFHIFKPIRETEAEVVAELVKRFARFQIRYAFVNVVIEHPWILFEDSPKQSRGRGFFVPDRMVNFVLDPHACLVQLRGRNEIKSARHGFSRPAQVRIHPSSTFVDLHYITQQVADFSHLSWRTFFPAYLPVTILYANFIAEMLDKLRRVPGWNPLAVNNALRRKKWFL